MKKTKNESGKSASKSMLGQKIGSSLDIKTNQDFNNEHPDHDVSGKLRGISNPKDNNRGTSNNQLSDIKWIIKPIAGILFVFMCSMMFTSCMDMKHGMKSDMLDHGPTSVWIKHDRFSPGMLSIPVNTTVTWTNKDWWHHTVSSDSGVFESGKIKARKTYTYKFTERGTYPYHCKVHDMMKAKIIVH